MNNQIINIEIANIVPNRFQPRLTFDEESLKELAGSIKAYGVIEPIILRKFGEKYEIIAGERRCRGATIAGLSSVPAIIMDVDDKKAAELALIENIQRKELTAIEEAKAYKNIIEMGGFNKQELADKIGKPVIILENKLKLLNLDTSVQDALLKGAISEKHAKSLLQVEELDKQKEVLNKIINERMSVKLADDYIKSLQDEALNKKIQDTSNDVINLNDLNTVSNALEQLDIKEEKSEIFNDKKITIEERENKNMNNENQMPNFNFGNNPNTNNNFPSLEDQTVNMSMNPTSEQSSVSPTPTMQSTPIMPEMPTLNTSSVASEQPTVEPMMPTFGPTVPDFSTSSVGNDNTMVNPTPTIEQPQINPTPVGDSTVSPFAPTTPVMPEQPIVEPIVTNPVTSSNNETFISDQPLENTQVLPTLNPTSVTEPTVSTPEIPDQNPINGPIIPSFNSSPDMDVSTTPVETPTIETPVVPTIEPTPTVTSPEPMVTPELSASNNLPNVEMPVQESPAVAAVNNAKLMEAVNGIRNIMPVLETKGFVVELEEKDLSGEYQMIIKLKK